MASAAEPEWPARSAADLSLFVTLLGFRIPADHCSGKVPRLRPEFDRRIETLTYRLRRLSRRLLATEAFSGLEGKPVPGEIIEAFRDSFEDTRRNFERRDADSICPATLKNLEMIDDGSLEAALRQSLMAVHGMIRNLERDRPR